MKSTATLNIVFTKYRKIAQNKKNCHLQSHENQGTFASSLNHVINNNSHKNYALIEAAGGRQISSLNSK